MDPSQANDTALLAQQIADAVAATQVSPWYFWLLGYLRKLADAGIMVGAAFIFLAFLDSRNARRGAGSFVWALKQIQEGNMAVASYFGWRYAATIIAMALIWKTT